MAENDDGQEKTQEPTGKRLGDAREKGQLAKTRELYGLVSIVVGLGGLLFYIFPLSKRVLHFAVSIYAQIPYTEFNDAVLGQLIQYIVYTLANVLALPMLFLWALLMVVGFAQNRFVLPKESLKFDPTRLNPIKGFKEKFLSWQPVVELIKGVMKLGLIGWAVYMGMRDEVAILPNLILESPENILNVYWRFAFVVLVRAIPIVILVVALDFAYQWYKTREQMMMTFQEVKDEMKQAEGDPIFKGMRRQRQREIAMMRTLQEVPKADVVVANPTHFAVAIRYRKVEADAPVVIAKGVDHLALKMRQVAEDNDVAVVENPPLARALHKQTKEGQQIPPDYYAAVAEVLAAIYKRRGTMG